MKAVILCGGRGTRLGEHGRAVPKALIRIGGEPIILHLMQLFAGYGVKDFVLCLGHLGDEIRSFFSSRDFGWKVDLVETGPETNTGGRLAHVREYVAGEPGFFVTYGDGLSDIDLDALLAFHYGHGRTATITAVHPRSPFGLIDVEENGSIARFREKPFLNEWINGGFFVFGQGVFDHLGDDPVLEREPFEQMAASGELMAFRHEGFWKCMDTFKDNLEFEELWQSGAPWKK